MRGSAVAMLLAGLLAVVACSDPQGVPKPMETTASPEPTADKEHPPEPEVPEVWPLTGVPGEVAERPVMSVKVENSPQARPQTGLGNADIVWEQLIEHGTTRLMAMYHSDVPQTVGPIRSLRPMDIATATPFGGQLLFSGAQSAFLPAAYDSSLQVLTNDAGDSGFYRSADRRAPHNVYGDTADFLAQFTGEVVDLEPVFEFAPEGQDPSAVSDGSEASAVNVSFPSTSPNWTWSGDAGAWQRSEGNQEAVTTDEGRITATNVLVLRVDVFNTEYTDPAGAPVPETEMVGSGEAIVATGGHTISGTWSKDDVESMIELQTEDGDEIALAPGNTWIELVPDSGSSVSID